MSLAAKVKLLYKMTLAPIRGASHAERLESFYGDQAPLYDKTRSRLLHGRRELVQMLPAPEGGTWVELGGGTAENLERLGERRGRLSKAYVVDLSPALLAVACRREQALGWSNVELVQADATTFALPDGSPDGSADVVVFSYSLTMIPDWFAAVDRAHDLLRPGGTIGVVDFHVSRKHPPPGRVRHPWPTRAFWPAWFALDNVHLNPDHAEYLRHRFHTTHHSEHRGGTARLPYYLFVGTKPVADG